jgi:solute carrier family 25 uncoupling protein 27
VQQGGVLSLWRGCWPNVQRAALVNLGDLTTYDYIKGKILELTSFKDNAMTHCLASGCAGYKESFSSIVRHDCIYPICIHGRLVGATMGTPADVVKARIMNQPTDSRGKGDRSTPSTLVAR